MDGNGRTWRGSIIALAMALLASASIRAQTGDTQATARLQELRARVVRTDSLFIDIRAIVALRNGQPVIEEYYGGATRDSLHDVRSVSKTIVAILIGMAIQDGHLRGVDVPLGELYDLKAHANYSAAKASVTLEQLLTMSSGFAGDDNDMNTPGNEENMYPQEDWLKWALDLPMDTLTPGERWTYFTAGVVILGDILHQHVPGGLEQYAQRRLFAPLGITKLQWQHTPQGVANTAGGLRMSALDYAKVGELIRAFGKWQDQQLYPEAWGRAMCTRHKETDNRGFGYGYLLWTRDYEVAGSKHTVFFSSGNGGNKVFCLQDAPYVVVVHASAYNMRYAHPQVDRIMERYILPMLYGER